MKINPTLIFRIISLVLRGQERIHLASATDRREQLVAECSLPNLFPTQSYVKADKIILFQCIQLVEKKL